MSAQSIVIWPEVLRSIDASTFDGSYKPIGSPLLFPSVTYKIYNASSVTIFISWDGSNDHEILPTQGFQLQDVGSNKGVQNYCAIPKNTQFYIRASAGSGLVYLSSYYLR